MPPPPVEKKTFSSTVLPVAGFNARRELPLRQKCIAVTLLVAVTLLAYCNCFSVPFHFDDSNSIVDNISIRQWSTAFSPPNASGETVSGRPLLNFTFRINYAISALDVWSYHVVNVLIHALAGLALFGVARRTFLLPCMRGWFDVKSAFWVALLIAAIWLAHPMNTESVTYIVQRAESFMALWYFLTLYCFIRGTEKCADDDGDGAGISRWWLVAAWMACLAGMASKEVMVSAPVILFLYDRAFIAGSFKGAWRRRRSYYMAFALTWILLIALMFGTGQRGNTVGFTGEVTWWAYGFTQCWAIVRYLGQAFWPNALIFDYGIEVIMDFSKVWPQALLLMALGMGTLIAFWRAPKIGWLAVFFFAVLAPTSSVIPVITQVAAEHRMYLPLAILVALVVTLLYIRFGRWIFWTGAPLVVLLVLLSAQRTRSYRDTMTLWGDVISKYPESSRANSNYGYELISWNRVREGLHYCKEAVRLNPKNGDALNNVGYAHACLGDYDKALEYYRKALAMGSASGDAIYNNVCFALYRLGKYERAWMAGEAALQINPHYTPALVNMGNILVAQKRHDDAVEYYKKALEIHPKQADALNNWGNVIALQRKLDVALEYYKKAVMYAPRIVDAQDNVARLLVLLGRPSEAIPYFEAELALKPDLPEAHKDMADALVKLERIEEALDHYGEAVRLDANMAGPVCEIAMSFAKLKQYSNAEKVFQRVLKIKPDSAEAHYNFGNMLALQGRYEDSVAQFRKTVRCDPGHAGGLQNLGTILMQLNRSEEALDPLEAALRLKPDTAPLRHNYAVALGDCGRIQDAIAQEEEALRLQPDMRGAQLYLKELRAKMEKSKAP